MSLFHVCIYKFDLMLHMLPRKIGGIIQKVVSLLKIKQNRRIDLIIHEASE